MLLWILYQVPWSPVIQKLVGLKNEESGDREVAYGTRAPLGST